MNPSERIEQILQKMLHEYLRKCSMNTSEKVTRYTSENCPQFPETSLLGGNKKYTVLECLRKLPRPQILKIGVLSLIWGSATHLPQKLTAPIVPILQRTYIKMCGDGKFER